MLDIVFLSNLVPPDLKDEVLPKRKGLMSESGESLQWRIIGGLEENLGYPVRIFNHMLVRSYPGYYPEPYIRRLEFSHAPGARDVNLPFLNVRYIKRLFSANSLKRELCRWAAEKNDAQKVIVAYSLMPEFTKAIALAKRRNPDILSCVIVADLPEYTVLTNRMSLSERLYLRWMQVKTDAQRNVIDRFVLLTEPMAQRLVTDQKYIVMEGIATDHIARIRRDRDYKTIVYAGTLHERFGVRHLVSAFRQIPDAAVRLILCGMGDSEEYIKAEMAKDRRIDFRGQLSRREVIDLLAEADVVVNPRCTEEEFTKYSFPSKNLEALSSGVPFVAYKLEGIPQEYDQWINYPADSSAKALAQVLEAVCRDDNGAYSRKAAAAREWVLSSKNAKAQTARMIKLFGKVEEDTVCKRSLS